MAINIAVSISSHIVDAKCYNYGNISSIAVHPDQIKIATGQMAGQDAKEGKVCITFVFFFNIHFNYIEKFHVSQPSSNICHSSINYLLRV